jgi:hypothetical protein
MRTKRRTGALIGLAALLTGACAACTPTGASSGLPSFDSLESTRQAVDELIGCVDDAPESIGVHNADGLVTTDSIKCSQSLEIFHFKTEESKDEIYSLFSDAEGTAKFVEGQNWFVVDFSGLTGSDAASDPRDLSALAEHLGAQYTEAK